MAVDTVGPVLLDELDQAWVDEEFGAIIAANFDDEYAGPPERPTSNGAGGVIRRKRYGPPPGAFEIRTGCIHG